MCKRQYSRASEYLSSDDRASGLLHPMRHIRVVYGWSKVLKIRWASYYRAIISDVSVEWFGGHQSWFDGWYWFFSWRRSGVPQRQHRIVPRNMYPVSFVCFCLSHRQHINLVLTYLLLIRLVDPRFITWNTIWKRCDDGYIFLRSHTDLLISNNKSTCHIMWLLILCAQMTRCPPLSTFDPYDSDTPIDLRGYCRS